MTEETAQPTQTSPAQPLNQPLQEDKKFIFRCLRCGHFLQEVVTNVGQFRILCRQSECKTYNIIYVHSASRVTIDLEPKKDLIKY